MFFDLFRAPNYYWQTENGSMNYFVVDKLITIGVTPEKPQISHVEIYRCKHHSIPGVVFCCPIASSV